MESLAVLNEILEWSKERRIWQRDAMRRLVERGHLNLQDVEDLTAICKSNHGLDVRTDPKPLTVAHLPSTRLSVDPVTLNSLTHHKGVNALAADQTLEFGSQLTVVYGANAAGKSGYTRILKRACRARGAEEILGNVVTDALPSRPSASIVLTKGEQQLSHTWTDEKPSNDDLARVSVFDHHCASVYVSQRTDVAYRPLGLDLFDKLSDGCEAVRKALEKERSILESQTLVFPHVAQSTEVFELVSNITSLTNLDSVRKLANLSEDEKERLPTLQARIRELESSDPKKLARGSELKSERVQELISRIDSVSELLSSRETEALFSVRNEVVESQRTVEDAHRIAFELQPLRNTGSKKWRELWNAAEAFSTKDVYTEHVFPFTTTDSRCVLCQQELTDEAARRFRTFHDYMTSDVERARKDADLLCGTKVKEFEDAPIFDEAIAKTIAEVELDVPELANLIREFFRKAECRRGNIIQALESELDISIFRLITFSEMERLASYQRSIVDHASDLRKEDRTTIIDGLKREFERLDARRILSDNLGAVIGEIERKKRIAAYHLCIEETRTNAITRKSSDLTKRVVTEQLTENFTLELKRLGFRHVEVEMVDAGGIRGVLYHKLRLRRAPKAELEKIVSEGEARCLSIASFFAELSTASDRSAILFDDPVSSLDHVWRRNVARRLVRESASRQVVAFTHDVVFLLALADEAKKENVDCKHQYLRRSGLRSGLSSQRLPWVAMKVKDRIGYLNELCQSAAAVYRKEDLEKYERDGAYLYGLLREAWERAVEEVLLAGIVERYRYTVQTQQADQLADIQIRDCQELDAGITKCSKWLAGHDQAPAENEPIPEPDEIRADINFLSIWVKRIRTRRGK